MSSPIYSATRRDPSRLPTASSVRASSPRRPKRRRITVCSRSGRSFRSPTRSARSRSNAPTEPGAGADGSATTSRRVPLPFWRISSSSASCPAGISRARATSSIDGGRPSFWGSQVARRVARGPTGLGSRDVGRLDKILRHDCLAQRVIRAEVGIIHIARAPRPLGSRHQPRTGGRGAGGGRAG